MKKVEQVWTELGKAKKPKRTNLNASKKIDALGKDLDNHIKEFQKHEAQLDQALNLMADASVMIAGVVAKVYGGQWEKQWDIVHDEMYYLYEEIGMFWTDSEDHDIMQGQRDRRDNLLDRVDKSIERVQDLAEGMKKLY